MAKNLAKAENLQEVAATTTNVELSKAEIATEVRKQAEELIGHRARIVPAGTIDWVEGWVKTTQADLRPSRNLRKHSRKQGSSSRARPTR